MNGMARRASLPAEVFDQIAALTGGLVVSCQAHPAHPLHGATIMAAMAAAVVEGGAVGIRASGVEDIAAVRACVAVPIIGIDKVRDHAGNVYITPSVASVRAIVAAGARLVALDGTGRPRPGGETLAQVINAIHDAGAAALADVSTLEEGMRAQAAGADLIGTTLSGYTQTSLRQPGPDLTLVQQLAARCSVSVYAEGRITTPTQAQAALAVGASFVVVGTAITDPSALTSAFVRALTLTVPQAGICE